MKKSMLTIATASLCGLFLLTGCGKKDDYVVSMKGGGITQEQYYNKIKTLETSQQTLQQMVIAQVAEEQCGDKVSDKDVDKELEKIQKQIGGKDKFEQQLKLIGQSESSFKKSLKQQLTIQELLKSNVKVTDDQMKKAFKDFHPEVEAQVICVSEKKKADDLLAKVEKDPKKFGEIAKKESADESAKKDGEITFDSNSTNVPAAVKEAAWKMKDGQISKVIKASTQDPSTLQTIDSYYIIKMNKQQDKGNDYKKYEKELKDIVTQQELSNPTFMQETIKKALKEEDVKVDDKDLQNVLAQFTGASNSDQKDDKKEEK